MAEGFNPQNNGAGFVVNAPPGAYRPPPDAEPIYVNPQQPTFFNRPFFRAALIGGGAVGQMIALAATGGVGAATAVAAGAAGAAVNAGLLRVATHVQERQRREEQGDTDVEYESSEDEMV